MRQGSAPICPACGGGHYPATTGSGRLVWCDGAPADPEAERARAVLLAERAVLLAERTTRPPAPPIESWEALALPDRI